jgi:hypothetical protein
MTLAVLTVIVITIFAVAISKDTDFFEGKNESKDSPESPTF